MTIRRQSDGPLAFKAGEIHYFRLDPGTWADRLRQLHAAGADNTVPFYLPWLLHEPAQGRFEFGAGDPRLDLARWLKLIAAEGLKAFVRPGPYIYAETENEGLPSWVLDDHPEIRKVYWTGSAYSDAGCETVVSSSGPTFPTGWSISAGARPGSWRSSPSSG